MTVNVNVDAYFRSLSGELSSKADRIRHLIGDSHFLSDGHHKEYLLRGLLERFLPAGFICSRGFVVRDARLQLRSKEQDILIVDTRLHAPLFYESGVVVTFPENVRAAISVKTTLDRTTARDALKGLDSIPDISPANRLWKGLFAFRLGNGWLKAPETLVQWLTKPPTGRTKQPRLATWTCGAIACDSTLFVTTHCKEEGEQEHRAYSTNLATALFMAELTDHLATCSKPQSSGINELLATMAFPRLKVEAKRRERRAGRQKKSGRSRGRSRQVRSNDPSSP